MRRSIFTTNTQASVALIPPVAVAGNDQFLSIGVLTAVLKGGGSYDIDGTITTYAWTEVTGFGATIVSPSSVTTSVTGLIDGNIYTFRLTVTDNDTLQHSDDIKVHVNTAGATTLTINASLPTVLGSGTLDFAGGEPYEIISLGFELFNTLEGDSIDFSGANTGVLDHSHPTRTGAVVLNSSGVVSKNYSSVITDPFECVVTITGRSSSEPIPASNSVLIDLDGLF